METRTEVAEEQGRQLGRSREEGKIGESWKSGRVQERRQGVSEEDRAVDFAEFEEGEGREYEGVRSCRSTSSQREAEKLYVVGSQLKIG